MGEQPSGPSKRLSSVIWLVLACVWLIVANVAAMLPSRDYHWRFAYFMIALGLPVLFGVFTTSGPWMGLAVLIAAMSVLRWPVLYLGRWLKNLWR